MENKLDQLFKDRLEGNTISPDASSWETISGNLEKRRRVLWMRRGAIAATIVLLLSIGWYSYHSSLEVENVASNHSNKPIEITENYSNDLESPNDEVGSEVKEESEATQPKNDDQKESVHTTTHTSKGVEESTLLANAKPDHMHIEVDVPDINHQSEKSSSAGNSGLEEKTLNEQKIESEIPTEQNFAMQETEMQNDLVNIDTTETNNPTKEYPKVRITYKASKGSQLVADQNDEGLLDKGINKITEFSDKRIVTSKVKSKLRNTKEDLMALNLGKLVNRSNKNQQQN